MVVDLNIKIKAVTDDLTYEKEFTRLLSNFDSKDLRKLGNFLKLYFDKEKISKGEEI